MDRCSTTRESPGRPAVPVGLEHLVELAHRQLGLDVVYVAEVAAKRPACRAVAGDAASFGLAAGELPAGQQTFCEALLAGEIPSAVADASDEPRFAELSRSAPGRPAAFVGVPIRLSDGTLYGVLCGLSCYPDLTLGSRDVQLMAIFADLMAPELEEQRRLERLHADLSELIDGERIDIVCQPIVELAGGTCLGLEALSRFSDPFGRPDEVFAAAQTVGLGLELERLAVREAWPLLELLGPRQFLTINLSPKALVQLAWRAQQRSSLPLPSLVVEITEHAVVDHYAELRQVLEPLRRRGLRVAIDDVGAGYASLHHVVELQPDFIKMDMSLVQGLAGDRARRVAAKAFVVLAHDLGATIIAEGVESAGDLATLREIGVQAAQGYLLGRPSADPADLTRWTAAAPPAGGHLSRPA